MPYAFLTSLCVTHAPFYLIPIPAGEKYFLNSVFTTWS